MTKSFEFTNNIRDVNRLFDTLIAENTTLLRLLLNNSQNLGSIGNTLGVKGEQGVTNPKYEWFNDQLKPVRTAIASFVTDGDGVGIVVDDASGLRVGSILRFDQASGASRAEQVLVTNIVTNTLTVTRDYNGVGATTLVVGDIVHLNSTPLKENTGAGDGLKHEAVPTFNATQIFDEVAEVSGTADVTASYDNYTHMPNQMKVAMQRLLYNLEGALYFGTLKTRSASVLGSMAGIRELITGNIISTGGAISQDHINDAFEGIASEGATSNSYLIIGHPTQTRKISALNTGGTNPVVFKNDQVGQRLGNNVTEFVSDIANGAGGIIFPTFRMVQDEVIILDLTRTRLKTMRGMTSRNAAENGLDGLKERLLTEVTLELKNGAEAHAKLTGLSL